MEIILLKDVKGIGKKGEIVKVNDGYGSNFLIPRGLAVVSNKTNQKKLDTENKNEQARQKLLKEEAEKLKVRLEQINVEFKAKVGSDGRMFGTISPKEIEEGLKKQWGITIDKRKFIDKYPAGTVNVHISEEK